jgi:hypothetical protein
MKNILFMVFSKLFCLWHLETLSHLTSFEINALSALRVSIYVSASILTLASAPALAPARTKRSAARTKACCNEM